MDYNKVRGGIIALCVVIIAILLYSMEKGPPGNDPSSCPSVGEKIACPDNWMTPEQNSEYGVDAYKICGPDMKWETDGTYGPSSCKVECVSAGKVPCEALRRCIDEGSVCGVCSMDSDCQNGGKCDSVKGVCVCPTGFYGPRCESKGQFACKTASDCGPGGSSCVSGKCICDPNGYWTTDPETGVPCSVCMEGYGPSPGAFTYSPGTQSNVYKFPTKSNTSALACSLKEFDVPVNLYVTSQFGTNDGGNTNDRIRACASRFPGSFYKEECNTTTNSMGSSSSILCQIDDYYAKPAFDPVSWNSSQKCNSQSSYNNNVIYPKSAFVY